MYARACEGCDYHDQNVWVGQNPEPYIYTVYDRIFGDIPAKNAVYKPYIYGLANPNHDQNVSEQCRSAELCRCSLAVNGEKCWLYTTAKKGSAGHG
jgi:hypothetical protein